MVMNTHYEHINFDITDTGTDDIVLGIPWLRMHNPTIDWTTGELQFERCVCKKHIPLRFQKPSEDEEHDEDIIRESTPDLRLKTRGLR